MLAAVHLINLLPSPSINYKTPHQLLHNTIPSYSHLRTIGCLCFPWLRHHAHGKLSPRSVPCIHLGYAQNHKGYKCYDPTTNNIYISRHVRFCESTFPFQTTNSPQSSSITSTSPPPSTIHPLTLIPASTAPHTSIPSLPEPPHKQNNHTRPPILPDESAPPISELTHPQSADPSPSSTQLIPNPHPMLTRSRTGHPKPKQIFDLSHTTTTPPTPTTYSQAAKLPHWKQAMATEIDALLSQHTWDLVPPPPHHNVIGCRWTYKTKLHSNGTIARFKARLVAQGYKQTPGLDYNETFSPVTKFPTIRTLLIVSTVHQWPILQLDVSNAFLHGTLS